MGYVNRARRDGEAGLGEPKLLGISGLCLLWELLVPGIHWISSKKETKSKEGKCGKKNPKEKQKGWIGIMCL